jgi:hypothetical protein
MSNKDTCPQASQAAAATTFTAEVNDAHIRGSVELSTYARNWGSQNTGNKLYKNA